MVVFFFYKQKTAYELRSRDWSSDVCSSDLRPICRHRLPPGKRPPGLENIRLERGRHLAYSELPQSIRPANFAKWHRRPDQRPEPAQSLSNRFVCPTQPTPGALPGRAPRRHTIMPGLADSARLFLFINVKNG